MPITVFQQSWGAVGSTITITLDALANAAFRQSDEVSNAARSYLDAHIFTVVGTTALSISSTGTVEIYGYGQVGDAKPWRTDTAGTSDAAIVNLPNARLLGVIQANSGSTIYAGGPFSVANAFGGLLPLKWGVIIANRTGAQLTNSANINSVFFSGYYEIGS